MKWPMLLSKGGAFPTRPNVVGTKDEPEISALAKQDDNEFVEQNGKEKILEIRSLFQKEAKELKRLQREERRMDRRYNSRVSCDKILDTFANQYIGRKPIQESEKQALRTLLVSHCRKQLTGLGVFCASLWTSTVYLQLTVDHLAHGTVGLFPFAAVFLTIGVPGVVGVVQRAINRVPITKQIFFLLTSRKALGP